MSRRLREVLLGVLILVAAAAASRADTLTAEAWREDLATYVKLLQDTHLNLHHTVSEADFERAVQDIHERIPELSDGEVFLELQRISTLVNDGHTWLWSGGRPYIRNYPIRVYWFEDGLYITHAMDGHEGLVGAKLTRIGNADFEIVLEAAEPYTTRDNEWTVKQRIIRMPIIAEFLHMKGFVGDMDAADFEYIDAKGETRVVTLSPVSAKSHVDWVNGLPPREGAPLYRTDTSSNYWTRYLKPNKTLYVKFNVVGNAEGGPHLAGFAKKLIEELDATKARKLVIDVRHNGGGNGDLLKPFIRRIAEHERINREGRLFVITSRRTFSAALMFTMRMERETNALFAGEPGGGKPNSYSEFNAIELPNSKVTGSISNRFHEEGLPGDTREFLPVDIPVPLTGADYFAGRDPVLEAVLAYKR